MFEGFEATDVDTGDARIFVRTRGAGSPLLLLHGFPQTHVMWRDVATQLASRFHVVCADLRGYGRSSCPPSTDDHTPYSKRVMAQDMVAVMERLGYPRFSIAGHDRGGRVAYRLALDHPERIARLAVLDVLPTHTAWELADARFALGFWPWSLLAQPAPLPERLLSACADAIVDHALGAWGPSSLAAPAEVRAAYIDALVDPAHAHAVCEEYRAAAALDREHDAIDLSAGQRIRAPLLALWSAHGPLGSWYEDRGGPIGIWGQWSDAVEGRAIDGGHFFPEERPEETADSLMRFFEP